MPITCYLSVVLTTLLLNPMCHLIAAKKPSKNCPNRCGDVMIHYPFGIGSNCSHDGNFTIFCNESTPQPKPFISTLNVELLSNHNSWYNATSYVTVMMPAAYNSCTAATDRTRNETVWNSLDLTGTPFSFSTVGNKFTSIGCRGLATLYDETGSMITGCSSNCDVATARCNGYLCCRSEIGEYLKNYSIRIRTTAGSCRLAFVSTDDFVDSIDANNHSSIPHALLVPTTLYYLNGRNNKLEDITWT